MTRVPLNLVGWLDGLDTPIILNATSNTSAWQTAYYDSGYNTGPYSVSADWSVDSSAISASPDGLHTTTVTADEPGNGCVSGNMGSQERYAWDGRDCYDLNFSEPIGDTGCTQVASVKIYLNGSTNVTDTTQNVIVGQQINLSIHVDGTTITPDHIQWSVPGNRIANYAASATSGTVTRLLNLQTSSLTFYWVDGGEARQVQMSCRIAGAQFDKIATFNVKRPTAQIMTTTGTPDVFTPSHGGLQGLLSLAYGEPSPGTPGIKFTKSVSFPQGFSGDIEWLQVVDQTTRTRTTNADVVEQRQGSGLLDIFYFYPSDTNGTQDSPGVSLTTAYKAISVNDNFIMYLMFVPTGTSGTPIYVPLRQVTWSWSGSAFRVGSSNNWVRNAVSNTANPQDADVTDCPQWSANLSSIDYH